MAGRRRFRDRHPVLGAACGAAATTLLVGLVFLGASTPKVATHAGPAEVLHVQGTPPPSEGSLERVEVFNGSERVSPSTGPLVTTYVSGTVPKTPLVATVMSDDSCATDASGVERCTHDLLLPDGSLLRVQHDHSVVTDTCPEVGDLVVVVRGR